jgi:lysophospholipase L1-like esterase
MYTQRPKILLVGSSHTRLFSAYVTDCLKNIAAVTKLPTDAGRTDEILISLPEWPVAEQNLIHVYSGHRDLIYGPDGKPHIDPGQFKINLDRIIEQLRHRTTAIIVFSNIPPVAEGFLKSDPERNERIALYNTIINEVTSKAKIYCHDFRTFISSYEGGEAKYIDGLHFTKKVYQDFAHQLADYFVGLLR